MSELKLKGGVAVARETYQWHLLLLLLLLGRELAYVTKIRMGTVMVRW